MARFFKYHSTDDLAAENSRLGLDLCFSEDLTPLFRPVTVGRRRVGNSLCIQPMEGCDGTADGKPDFSGIWQVLDDSTNKNVEPHRASYGVRAGQGAIVDPADGTVHLFWWVATATPYVLHAEAPADVSSWSTPVIVSHPSELAVRPAATIRGTTLWVAYEVHQSALGGTPR